MTRKHNIISINKLSKIIGGRTKHNTRRGWRTSISHWHWFR